MTSAPNDRQFFTFTSGANFGITTVTEMPSSPPWYASASAWFPADAATTPRRFSLVGEQQQLVPRTALLERAGHLEVVELAVDLGPAQPAESESEYGQGLW